VPGRGKRPGLRFPVADRYGDLQGYWSQRAREKGVLTERQLKRYLKRKD